MTANGFDFNDELLHIRDSRKPALLAGSIVLISLATGCVILRLVARRAKRVPFGWDDYTVLIALV